MLSSWRSRISAVACVGIAVSGWLPIPLPVRQVERLLGGIELAGEPVEVSVGQCVVRWAPARLYASDVVLRRRGKVLFHTEEVRLRFGLIPGRRDFLGPRSLALAYPELAIDSELIADLGAGGGSPRAPQRGYLPLVIEGGKLSWRDEQRDVDLELQVDEFRGRLSADEGALHGRVRTSFGMDAEAWLRAEDSFSRWTLDFFAEGQPVQEPFGDLLPFRMRAAGCSARLHLEQGPDQPLAGEMDLSLTGVELAEGPFPIAVELEELAAKGNLRDGVRVEFRGLAEDIEWSGAGWLASEEGSGLVLSVAGAMSAVQIDAERIRSLDAIAPSLRTVFEALELRGEAAPRFALQWREGSDPLWAAHAPFSGMQVTYRGFLEADGDKPSFDYPVTGLSGDVVAAGSDLLIRTQGRMGEATVDGKGVVRITKGPAGLALDIDVGGLPVDARVTRAISGTPQVATVWRELGQPSGGAADLLVRLRRERGVRPVGMRLFGKASDTRVRLTALPVPVTCRELSVEWAPGAAEIEATILALGGRGRAIASLRRVEGAARPQIAGRVSAAGLRPSAEERMILQSYLQLPEEFERVEWDGAVATDLTFRSPATSDRLQACAVIDPREAVLRWQPTELEMRAVSGKLEMCRSGPDMATHAGRLEFGVAEGNLVASATLFASPPPAGQRGRILVATQQTRITPPLLATLRELLGEAEETARLGWSGGFDLVADAELPALDELRARVDLRKVVVEEREYLPGNRATLEGRVEIDASTLRSAELRVTSPAGSVRLTDLELVLGAEVATLKSLLHSPEGIQLSDRFSALASPEAWAAAERIGLAGRVGAESLRLLLIVEPDGVHFTLNGKVLLRAMQVQGPPRMRRGSGEMVFRDFAWRGPDEFGGLLVLRDAQVQVSDLNMRDISAKVSLSPKAIRFEQFQGSMLGGRVATFGVNRDGEEEQGSIRLGLEAKAPVAFSLFLEDLSLRQVREELKLGGNLDGVASGWLRFRSATPSPLDYTGEGHLEFQDGVLGSVPVLAQMWRVAGVRPPVFDRGQVDFHADAGSERGTIRIEHFELNHDLLEVRGSGWLDMDSYLRAKATVRTFSFLGRLPIFKEFVDLLVEQDIYGPIGRPKIRQRALGKLMGRDRTKETFPLWVPRPERRDWRASPALPVTEGSAAFPGTDD